MMAAKFDYYCRGNPVDQEGNKVGTWRECSELCFNEKRCMKWTHIGKRHKCFMYSECVFTNTGTRYKSWKYVVGEKSCSGSDS